MHVSLALDMDMDTRTELGPAACFELQSPRTEDGAMPPIDRSPKHPRLGRAGMGERGPSPFRSRLDRWTGGDWWRLG